MLTNFLINFLVGYIANLKNSAKTLLPFINFNQYFNHRFNYKHYTPLINILTICQT